MELRFLSEDIPFLTTDQMREVDRAMIEDYGILLIQMMENAGRVLAQLARKRFLNGSPTGRKVTVFAGTGGNGGGGLVCARRLHGWGANVDVLLSATKDRLGEIPRHQLSILEKAGVDIRVASDSVEVPETDLIVDAVIGYSLRGAPRGASAGMIHAINASVAPVLSLDAPSGLDTSTGTAYEPTVRADATLTLALPKVGLRADGVREFVGELYLGDISVPPQLYSRSPLCLAVPNLFAEDDVLRVW